MKAMDYATEARYPTAVELSADIERWLSDEPVSVYKESMRVRAARWVKRHKVFSATIGVTLVLISVGSALLALLTYQHSQELNREKEGLEFVLSVIQDSGYAKDSQGQNETVRGLVERIEKAVIANDKLPLQQKNDLIHRVGATWFGLSDYESAARVWGRLHELEKNDDRIPKQDRLESQANLSLVLMKCGRYDEALTLCNKAFEEMQRLEGPKSRNVLAIQHHLASIYSNTGDHELSIENYEKVLSGYREANDRFEIVRCQANLALALNRTGQFELSEKMFVECLSLKKELEQSGEFKPGIFWGEFNYAKLLYDKGELRQSLEIQRSQLELIRSEVAPTNPNLLKVEFSTAQCQVELNGGDQELAVMKKVLAEFEQRTSKVTRESLETRSVLILALADHGHLTEAVELVRQTLDLSESVKSEYFRARLMLACAVVLVKSEAEDAVSVSRHCLDLMESYYPNHWETQIARSLVGRALLVQERYQEALPFLKEASESLAARRKEIPFDHQRRLTELSQALELCQSKMQ